MHLLLMVSAIVGTSWFLVEVHGEGKLIQESTSIKSVPIQEVGVMSSTQLTPITSHGTNGETAPESAFLAEKLQDADVEARSMPTGDHALYVNDDDLTPEVRRMISRSHYTEGLPRTAAESDGYTGFKPKRGKHPDGR